jgi:nucleoside-diphosphate-sugar epimerase
MTTTETTTSAVVFGSTGAIGTLLLDFLAEKHPDWTIKAVSRSYPETPTQLEGKLSNVTQVRGNVEDEGDVRSLCENDPCDIIYCCVGFSQYEAKYWAQHWPIVVKNLLNAVKPSSETTTGKKKKLVFCDNIYAYGPGTNISIHTELVAVTTKTKPGVRALLHERFRQHMQDFPGTLTVIGAADFFGPHVTDKGFLGDTFTSKILSGSSKPMAIGRCDRIHDFCYAPDFAMALAMASVDPAAYDSFWIAPHSIHGKTMQDIGNAIAVAAGKPSPVNISVLGPFMVQLLSPFVSFLSSMREMLPIWTNDYTVDDSDFVKQFGVEATPMDEALAGLVQFYQAKIATTAS